MRFRSTKYSRDFKKPLFLVWPLYGAPSSCCKKRKKPSASLEPKGPARQIPRGLTQNLFWKVGKISNN